MTIKQMIVEACKEYKGRYVYTILEGEREKKIKYGEFIKDIYKVANYFADMNLHKKTIAIFGKNSYEWIVIYCAILFSGNIVAPLDKDMAKEEVDLFMEKLQCEVLLFDSEKAEIMENELLYNAYAFDDIIDRASCKYASSQNLFKRIDEIYIGDSDDAMIICTSGTTSLVKKVVLSHMNIVSNVVAVSKRIQIRGKGLLVLPLSHMYSLTAATLVAIHSGVENILSKHVRFFTKEIRDYKPNFVFLVPMLVEKLYEYLINNEENMLEVSKYLSIIFCGGAPLSKDILDKFGELDIDVINGYGMTECSPVISTNTKSENRIGSVGKALEGITIKVFNADEDGVGELYVKGPSVMRGYLDDAGANQASFEGEWFKTGDIVKIDVDGYIFIKGRAKNLILLGNGQNVYPEEVERQLLTYDEIEEVMIYQKNNKIVAEVYPNCNEKDMLEVKIAVQKVIAHYNSKQPYYKNISELVIREQQFEKNSMNKIKRVIQQ